MVRTSKYRALLFSSPHNNNNSDSSGIAKQRGGRVSKRRRSRKKNKKLSYNELAVGKQFIDSPREDFARETRLRPATARGIVDNLKSLGEKAETKIKSIGKKTATKFKAVPAAFLTTLKKETRPERLKQKIVRGILRHHMKRAFFGKAVTAKSQVKSLAKGFGKRMLVGTVTKAW